MSVVPSNTGNTNSFALTTSWQRRAWKRPTCIRIQKWSGAYGAGGTLGLDPMDQWEGPDHINPNRTEASVTRWTQLTEQTPHLCEQAVVGTLAAASVCFFRWV